MSEMVAKHMKMLEMVEVDVGAIKTAIENIK